MPLRLVALLMFGIPALVSAQATTGGVNFTDTLGYTKPAFYSITEPNEASAANKYYVSLSSGSGTTCSQAAPCTLTTVSGKTGVSDGGGAYVYVKGSGSFDDVAIRGSSGSEVVLKPWAAGTTGCVTECTATFTGRNNWTANKIYMIVDGGPDLNIRFTLNGANQFDPNVYFNATSTQHHDIYFYRTHWNVANAGEHMAAFGGFDNLWLVNSELEALGATDSGNQHHVYLSGCNGSVTLSNLHILNNIFRDSPGEAIELRAAGGAFSNVTVTGNVFHDVGKGTCSTSWKCRSAMTIVVDGTGCAGGGSFASSFIIANNLIWDVGEGCLRPWDMPAAGKIYNNTCYNWGSGSVGNGLYTSAAFADFSFTSSVGGDYRNNIIYAAGNDPGGNTKTPFPNNASVDSFNACISTVSCGTSKQTISSASFVSLDENDPNFLQLAAASTPIDHGTAFSTDVPLDYLGYSRTGTYDIGAFEFGASGGVSTSGARGKGRMRIQGK